MYDRDGITLVVSPLIALIKDQLNELNSLGIYATALLGKMGARAVLWFFVCLW